MTDVDMDQNPRYGNQLPVVAVKGEPRILDMDFAVRLGFANPIDIRKLVRRHEEALTRLGTLATVATVKRGQNATEFYLNRKQAIFITAKSETTEATDITIEIIERFDAYERGSIGGGRRTIMGIAKEAAGAFKGLYSIARLAGLDRNQAALAANKAIANETGVDPLGAMGVIRLIAPQNEDHLSSTDIGVKLGGKSAIAVNALLQEFGFQTGWRDAKNRPHWEPTEKGKPFAVWVDTGKKHSNGTPVRQLRWSSGTVGALSEEISRAA